ncbi:uncharacterized protein LOC123679046 [Harmonia axyridis]|uniref:uncharacterized protein LOC123679046 n=1 Tax=Harmonia axyridis TaxID=115357 RepID=UPI001E277F38|nr:uncharacterized protein LOC123679046 [Harmonia axyridis]
MPLTCIVTGCVSRHDRDRFGFYHIPTITKHRFLPEKNELSRKRRALWLDAINRDDLTDSKIKYQRVCSRHFITGKPAALMDETNIDWVPTQNMGPSGQNIRKTYKVDVEMKERLDNIKIELPQNESHPHEEVDFNNDGLKTDISTQTKSVQTID